MTRGAEAALRKLSSEAQKHRFERESTPSAGY